MRPSPLSRDREKQLLASMLVGLGKPPEVGVLKRFAREFVWLVMSALVAVVVLGVLRADSLLTTCTALGAALLGFGASIAAARAAAQKEWPVVARCLDRSLIEQRLRELDD